MWRHDHAQHEMDHIKAMIFQLEHQGVGHGTASTSAVVQLDYWRTRIRAVLTLPDMPSRITKQGADLLARLDRIPAAPRNAPGHD